MKLLLEKDGVKRSIDGPFRLCCSKADALVLVEELLRFAESGAVYGWFDVVERTRSVPNNPPIPWSTDS
jgi:hypothetical protein